jgi:hypothetical protein
MTLRWSIVRSSAPSLRRWGNEVVVHHALSNDTYRLSATAGLALSQLMPDDMVHADGMDGLIPLDDADIESALLTLAELGFVAQC